MLWTLFVLWLVFALLDMTISGLAIRAGAREIGLLFLISNDWQLTCFVKGIASFLFGMVLVAYTQKALLAISCAAYMGICIFNGAVLLHVMRAQGSLLALVLLQSYQALLEPGGNAGAVRSLGADLSPDGAEAVIRIIQPLLNRLDILLQLRF